MISLQNDVVVETYGILKALLLTTCKVHTAESGVKQDRLSVARQLGSQKDCELLRSKGQLVTSLLTARLLQYQAIPGNPK